MESQKSAAPGVGSAPHRTPRHRVVLSASGRKPRPTKKSKLIGLARSRAGQGPRPTRLCLQPGSLLDRPSVGPGGNCQQASPLGQGDAGVRGCMGSWGPSLRALEALRAAQRHRPPRQAPGGGWSQFREGHEPQPGQVPRRGAELSCLLMGTGRSHGDHRGGRPHVLHQPVYLSVPDPERGSRCQAEMASEPRTIRTGQRGFWGHAQTRPAGVYGP